VYACAHLSNSASLLLPVSNLTNLLAFAAAGISFTRFAGLMALPWLAAIGIEYLVFRRFFAADLRVAVAAPEAAMPKMPVFTLTVVVLTLVGFAFASAAGVNPAWVAAAGALVLAARALREKRTTITELISATSPVFLAFVLALGIVVRAVTDHGLAGALGHLIPAGTSLPELLALAALAALLANIINNLPAVLVLLPLAAPVGTGAVLAVLLGVNIGPNLTYAGSLATLLWRRIVHAHEERTDLREFTRLALWTVPAGLGAATVALWVSLRLIGG
jgi:arsenical pump membrane protein